MGWEVGDMDQRSRRVSVSTREVCKSWPGLLPGKLMILLAGTRPVTLVQIYHYDDSKLHKNT